MDLVSLICSNFFTTATCMVITANPAVQWIAFLIFVAIVIGGLVLLTKFIDKLG